MNNSHFIAVAVISVVTAIAITIVIVLQRIADDIYLFTGKERYHF